MEETIIFVLCFYLVITNPFIKIRVLEDGIYYIGRAKDYTVTANGYEEILKITLKKLIKFKNKSK